MYYHDIITINNKQYSTQDMETILEEYCNYHLYEDFDKGMLLEGLLQTYSACHLTSSEDSPSMHALTTLGHTPDSIADNLATEFADTDAITLTKEQQIVLNILK